MPGGDGTGPYGNYRNCMPVDPATPVYGAGFSRGRGFGGQGMYNPRGMLRPRFSRFMANPITKEEELRVLKEHKQGLEKRITELEK